MRMHIVTHHFCLLLLLICFYGCQSAGYGGARGRIYDEDEPFTQDFLMPGVRPTQPDEYLCTAMSIPVNEIYIVDFEPKASMDTAHHMLLFGCDSIEEQPSKAWNCGSMGTCSGASQILFAWARNAPAPNIPPNVGFKIGNQAKINFLVLQIHYGHVEAFQDGSVDHSGLTLTMTTRSQQYLAGIYLLVSGRINIPPHAENVHTDIACDYMHSVTIHPFAFRTHAHELARVITGYRIRNGYWQVLGKGNPQWPQAFYPMEGEYDIRYRDILAARCTFSAPDRDSYTHVGPTANDEMCNFYMMYYTDANHGFSYDDCTDTDPDLFQYIPLGSDDPPPDPIGFSPDMMHHHHEVHHDPEISIPAYDHDHDLPENYDGPVDYIGGSSSEDGGPDMQLTTPMRNVATDSSKVTTEAEGNAVESVKSPQDLTNQETPPAKKPAELHLVKDWPVADLGLGQVAGVAVDSKGDVHVFHRAYRVFDASSFDIDGNFVGDGPIVNDTVMALDKNTGSLKHSWGANKFYLPHGLTIDHEDNIWVTDVALHQVFKYPPGGADKPLLTLGQRLKHGKDTEHFCKPTDVAVDTATGEFFVADGYCNSRIMKFSPEGKLLMKWGDQGGREEASIAEFIIPHSLTMVPEKNQMCVADREHGRILCFDTETGTAGDVFQPSNFGGRVFATEYSKRDGGILYAVNGPVRDSKFKVQGFSIGFEDGSMLQTWSPNDKGFRNPHDVAVSPDDSTVYVVEINPNAVWKFELDLGIHENDKKSALGSLPENNLDNDASMNDAIKDNSNKSPVMSKAAHAATAIVVCILIVPIVCIFIVAIFVRLRDQGRLGMMKGFPRYKSTQDRFSVGNFFNKRKGFNPVTTEGSDVEDEGSWTDGSDVEEYSRLTGTRTQNL